MCWPIAAGDTAASLARRLTGASATAYSHTFQIRDPARRMFVPKSHYQRLQPDWQACVAPGPIANAPGAYAPVVELASSATALPDEAMTAAPPPQALDSIALVLPPAERRPFSIPYVETIGAALLLITLLSAGAGSLGTRPIPPHLQRAGENFVAVFGRPLVDESSKVPPIQTRMRFRRRKQQLEISIAPGPGHRYPNLADHKKNVEYDVDRVLRVLGNYALVRPPRASGKWIVVTIGEIGEGGT